MNPETWIDDVRRELAEFIEPETPSFNPTPLMTAGLVAAGAYAFRPKAQSALMGAVVGYLIGSALAR